MFSAVPITANAWEFDTHIYENVRCYYANDGSDIRETYFNNTSHLVIYWVIIYYIKTFTL